MTRYAITAFLCTVAAAPSAGAETRVLQGAVESISTPAWSISGFDSALELTAAGLRGEFRIARIAFTSSGQVFDDTRVVCRELVLTTSSAHCASATFSAAFPGIGRQEISGEFTYHRDPGTATITLVDATVAGGAVQCEIIAGSTGVNIRYDGRGLNLSEFFELASTFNAVFSAYSVSGFADMSGTVNVPEDGPLRINLLADIGELALANDAGTIATAGVTGSLDLEVNQTVERSIFTLDFNSNQGEVYLEPVYANFSEHAFHLRAEDVATTDFASYDIPWLNLRQATILDLNGSAVLQFATDAEGPPQITADVELHDASVANLYTSLVQVKLAGTVLGSLETAGRLSGTVSVVDSALSSTALNIEDVILDDTQGRFAIYDVNGSVDWSADESVASAASEIRWGSATAYNLAVAGGKASIRFGDNDIELLAPLKLQTMGGALSINQFVMHEFGTDEATGQLDAELEPIQLGQLTGAFGWPAFSGTLSGRLPLLQLENNVITVGGTLTAEAFDGSIDVSRLTIEQPFGRVPRMQADIRIRDLDLERVTDAYSFGLIQGRLSGDVAGLKMQNWRPVAMDMHLYTPADDKSRHRISQRAVENLASVGGGGAAAALSTGFLKFFEVFAYDRIGLRCVLENGICAMSGAGPARSGALGPGYYIVKGRGLPRIDVLGYRDTVSWPRLVEQLVAITKSAAPTVN